MLADTVYGDPSETPPAGRARAQAMLDAILSAASAGGFTQFDILATLLSRNEVSPRVNTMAIQACEAAGSAALGKIFGAIPPENKSPKLEQLGLSKKESAERWLHMAWLHP